MKFVGDTKVPVVNRTIWIVLLFFVVVQNTYLYWTYEEPSSSEPISRDGADPKRLVREDYPSLICSEGENASFREYTVKSYGILPDQYNDRHFLIYALDTNGLMVSGSTFSISRCQIKNDTSIFMDTNETK